MKITILNGNPNKSSFDTYQAQVQSALESENHRVTQINLRDLPLRYCIGCWGCWVKTPVNAFPGTARLKSTKP
jgi:multimeric flavodoxin WrbA